MNDWWSGFGSVPSNAVRKTFNPSVVGILNEFFNANPVPTAMQRHQLASHLGLTTRQVQVWFSNKRQRLKRRDATELYSSHVQANPAVAGTAVMPPELPPSRAEGARAGEGMLFFRRRCAVPPSSQIFMAMVP